MLTQRTVVGGVRNLLSYSKYRIYRKNVLLSAFKPQIKSCSPFHQSAICAIKIAGTSRKTADMADKEVVRIYRSMTIGEFAETLKKTNEYVIKRIENAQIMDCDDILEEHTIIDHEVFLRTEALLLGYKVEFAQRRRKTEKENTLKIVSNNSALVPRPPVVTIMGHVDHGKTTLLDTLRKSNIVAKEFGGITQHIGAFLVSLPSGEKITFLDTPGHAAFSAMRARGAKLTDIIILVVAADDGVSPQTIESIEHAKKANVPIIVALNKIDKVNGDFEKLKLTLMEHDVIVEEAGGNVQLVKISALKGTNINALQEAVIAQAELMELNGDPTGDVQGSVVESEFHSFLGKIATIIIQKGVLRIGDVIVAGKAYAKVRKMLNEHGQEIHEAGLSIPVRVVGWRILPSAGEEFHQVMNERDARNYISLKDKEIRKNKPEVINPVWEEAKRKLREFYLNEKKKKLSIDRSQRFYFREYLKPQHLQHANILGSQTITSNRGPCLFIMLMCDVDGSLEAIMDVLSSYSSSMCELNIVESKVGNISKTEIDLAILSDAVIYGFNIKPSSDILEYAKENKVKIKMHNVIYKLFDCLKHEINNQLPTITEEEEQKGEAAFLTMFNIEVKKKTVHVIGCKCTDGKLFAEEKFRILRGSQVIFDGKSVSINMKKTPVDSVDAGQECGLVLDGFNGTLQTGDKIVCYSINKNTTQLDWDPGFTNPKS